MNITQAIDRVALRAAELALAFLVGILDGHKGIHYVNALIIGVRAHAGAADGGPTSGEKGAANHERDY